MKKLLALSALCLTISGAAGEARADWFGLTDPVSATTAAAAKAPVAGGTAMASARVRWLDKQTNRVEILVLKAGTAQTPGGLNVAMTKCLADYGNVPGQDVAWIEVREKERSAPWFAGWMFNTFPEVATLDHPRYDLQLVGCGDKPRARAVTPVKPQEVTKEATLENDSESPGVDSESKSDPYYVPGVENPAAETPAPAGAAPAVTPTESVPVQNVPAQPAAPAQPEVRPMVPGGAAVDPQPVAAGQRLEPAKPADVNDPDALQRMMDGR